TMDNAKAFRNLVDATVVLDKFGLTNFLIDGTLLGVVRENDFIGHDTDLDLGVFMEEWDFETFSKVVLEMMKHGFILYHSFGTFGRHFEAAWYRDGIKIDFFFYYKVGEKIRFNAFLNGGRTLPNDILTYEYDRKHFDSLEYRAFKERTFPTPSDPEGVLEAKYGKEWRVPVKKWDWARDPKNLI